MKRLYDTEVQRKKAHNQRQAERRHQAWRESRHVELAPVSQRLPFYPPPKQGIYTFPPILPGSLALIMARIPMWQA